MVRIRRCDNCRKRKIKCDEVQPVCGQCKRGKRNCFTTIRTKFVPEKQKGEDPGSLRQQCPQDSKYDGKMLLIKSRESTSGVFHKFRFDRPETAGKNFPDRTKAEDSAGLLIRNPSANNTDLLRAEFVSVFNPERGGLNSILHNTYLLGVLPVSLGHSDALDHAVHYLIQTHQKITNGITKASSFATPQTRAVSHMRAIKSLQAALVSLSEQTHSTTLAAIGTLTFTEAVGNYRRSSAQWVTHCKGIVTFLKSTGPTQNQSDLALSIIRAFTGCIIVFGALGIDENILEQPGWRETVFNEPGASFYTQVGHRATQQFSRLSVLMKHIRSVGMGHPAENDIFYLSQELADIRLVLSDLLLLAQNGSAGSLPFVEIASPSGDPEVPTIYHYTGNMDAARAMLTIWATQILINAILIRLWNALVTSGEFFEDTPLECEMEMQDRMECISRSAEWYEDYKPMIKLHTGTKNSGSTRTSSSPIKSVRGTFDSLTDIPVCLTILPNQIAGGQGAMYMVFPMAIAFRFASTSARRSWLLKKISLYASVGGLHAAQYSPERVDWVVNMLAGESNPFQASGVPF